MYRLLKCGSSWVVSIDMIDGQHLDEWLRITPGGRKCWNITLQDDDVFQLQGRNTHEYLSLRTDFYTTSRYIQSSSRVVVVDNERSKIYKLWRGQWMSSLDGAIGFELYKLHYIAYYHNHVNSKLLLEHLYSVPVKLDYQLLWPYCSCALHCKILIIKEHTGLQCHGNSINFAMAKFSSLLFLRCWWSGYGWPGRNFVPLQSLWVHRIFLM